MRETLKRDLVASLAVFLVALPLCLGIAIASGAPSAAGLVTGVVGGILVGALAGCPLQVSGPAAGLVVIVWDIVRVHGMKGLAAAMILAGVLQALAGFARLGRYFQAVSPAVVQGMLTSIGLLIVLGQALVMLDLAPRGGGLENAKALLALGTAAPNLVAGGLALGTIAVVLLWDGLVPKRWKVIPGSLVAVVLFTTVAAVAGLAVKTVELPASLADGLSFAGVPTLLFDATGSLLLAAVTIAFVASAESLLCSGAVDRMVPEQRTDYDRELVAQGAGNFVCGVLGGLPLTGVIVRSAANVGAGAKTRLSTVLHGIWLLSLVALVPHVLSLIPVAVLAAILVVVGAKLVAPKAIRALAAQSRWELVICLGTVAAIVTTDLLRGILCGFALSLVRLAVRVSKLETRLESDAEAEVLRLQGTATFLSIPRLTAALDAVPRRSRVVIDGAKLSHIDHACMGLLRSWAKRHEDAGGDVTLRIDDGRLSA